jgi:choline monooxygenase
MSKPVLFEVDQQLKEDPTTSFTMPARWYLDPEIFEREKEAIFYRNWHYVTHRSALAEVGDYATLRIADESVLVIRGKDGGLQGFYNVCKHRAHELLEGSGNTKFIVCPYHAWTYGLDGSFRGAPMIEALPEFQGKDYCLTPVRVEDFCGLVFVNLDPEAEALATQAAGLAEDLREKIPGLEDLEVIDVQSFSTNGALKANWKVVADNYMECYHCPKAHPDFCDLLEIDAYQIETYGIWSRQFGPKGRPHNSAYEFAEDAPIQTAGFWYLWPTTTINYVPGEPMVQVLAILPQDIETTTFSGHRLAPGADTDEDRITYLCNTLAAEDQSLVESVQRGLKSRSYDRGPFVVDASLSGTGEQAVHHFHRLVKQALGL